MRKTSEDARCRTSRTRTSATWTTCLWTMESVLFASYAVAAGGFLGLGETKFLIPVDAITAVGDEAVHVNQTREHVASGPRYDPEDKPHHLNDVYDHYGFLPFWTNGYIYPGLPSYSGSRDRPRS